MASCAKCNVVLEEKQSKLECGNCRKLFHPNCVGLSLDAVQIIAEDAKRGIHWLCTICVAKVSPFSIQTHPALDQLRLKIIAEVQVAVNQAVADIQHKVDSTAEEMKQLKQQHEVSLRELLQRVNSLELNQAEQVQDASFRFDDAHRQLRRDEVVIMRVPFKEDEDLRKYYLAILTTLQLPAEQYGNVMLRRISRPKPQAASSRKVSTPPIVVAFESRFKRNGFMKAYFEKTNLSLKDLGFPSEDRIYINENLSAQNYAAFQLAMGWKREKKINSVKVSDGMVFIKITKEAKPERIFHHTRLWDKEELPKPPQLFAKPTLPQ